MPARRGPQVLYDSDAVLRRLAAALHDISTSERYAPRPALPRQAAMDVDTVQEGSERANGRHAVLLSALRRSREVLDAVQGAIAPRDGRAFAGRQPRDA